MTRKKRKNQRKLARQTAGRPARKEQKQEPQANTTVPPRSPDQVMREDQAGTRVAVSTATLQYRCDRCGRTTRTMAIRNPITIMGIRVGEPPELRSCPECSSGTPRLIRTTDEAEAPRAA